MNWSRSYLPIYWRLVLTTVLVGLLASGCTADEQPTQSRAEATAKGRAAYEAGNFETAYEELYPIAKAGDPLSQFYIARMYHFGEGRQKDIDRAIEWYKRSADAGAAPAQYHLGRIYDVEKGYQDTDQAITWYSKAASNGLPQAMHNLGRLYHDQGEMENAFNWEKRAADSGSPKAQHSIGIYYEKGIFVETDPEQARKYYRLSAQQGYNRAMVNLAVMYDKGIGFKRDLKKVYQWFLLASENGWEPARIELERLELILDEKTLNEARTMAARWRQSYLDE